MNNAQQFAAVLYSAWQEKTETDFNIFFTKCIAYLKSKKIEKMLPHIHLELEQLIENQKNNNKTTLIVRDKKSESSVMESIMGHADSFDLNNISIEHDKNVVGGYVLRSDNMMIDASYKKALLNLYKCLVK